MYLVLVEFLSRFRYLEDCWHDFFVGMIFFFFFFSTNAGDFQRGTVLSPVTAGVSTEALSGSVTNQCIRVPEETGS